MGQPDHADPAHEGRPGSRPDPGGAGHGAAARGVPDGLQPRSAHEHAASRRGPRSSSARRCTPRCGNTRVSSTTSHAARTRRARRRTRVGSPGRRRRRGGSARRTRVDRCRGRAGPRPAGSRWALGGGLGGRHPRTDRRRSSDRQSQFRQAGLCRRSRGGSAWSRA